jgi:DNA-binding GntR family transcriptional regulator
MLAIAQDGMRPGKSAEVFDGLKRMIMLGEVAPGLALLELELAQRFQCSQGTVREALLALQEEGLVHRLPHKGTRVADCTMASRPGASFTPCVAPTLPCCRT